MLRTSKGASLTKRGPSLCRFSLSLTARNSLRPPSKDDVSAVTDGKTTPVVGTRSTLEEGSRATSSSSTKTPQNGESIQVYDIEGVKRRVRSWSERAAIVVRTRADDFTASAKTTLSHLGLQLNKVTGYEAIEALKRDVVDQEARINETRQAAREAKTVYEQAVVQRSNSQREVNDLLQRKSNWTDGDVSRFTTLVRQDHLYEQEEIRAKAAVDELEDRVEREFSRLMRTILARYHEEQVWSDKIRSASTYGSLAALGLNMLVFVMAIVVVEPWKRRRLAQTFEKKIEELSTENSDRLVASMNVIREQLLAQERMLNQVKEDVVDQGHLAATLTSQTTPPPMEVVPQDSAEIVTPALNRWELGAVAFGAFAAGIMSSLWFSR